MTVVSCFPGKIAAYHDIWLIGDDFLYEMLPVLQTMKSEALAQKKTIPYIFKYYNVAGFYSNPLSLNKSVMARIFNSVVEALNENIKLPKFVVFMPDIDFPRNTLCNNFGMTLVFEDCIIYMVKQIERYFHTRREDLKNKRLGAVPFETKFIWV